VSYAEGLQSLELPVTGMSCTACVQRIRQALESLPGVEPDNVEIGRVRLDYYTEALTAESIRARIEALGYGVPSPQRSRNPLRRLLDRMGEANDKALAGKRLDCCKITDAKPGKG
jgi:Cu+-exporting ATPase